MSEHKAVIRWSNTTDTLDYDTYPRDHVWTFPGGQTINGSAAPDFKGSTSHTNPEEALVAALSSCHMLTFLAIAAKRGVVVGSYTDDASGWLERNDEGRLAITRVTLRPEVTWVGEPPDRITITRWHEKAHTACFIANSVTTKITVDPQGLE